MSRYTATVQREAEKHSSCATRGGEKIPCSGQAGQGEKCGSLLPFPAFLKRPPPIPVLGAPGVSRVNPHFYLNYFKWASTS